jgi:hypothetical protein
MKQGDLLNLGSQFHLFLHCLFHGLGSVPETVKAAPAYLGQLAHALDG